jgi:hypothetical protein
MTHPFGEIEGDREQGQDGDQYNGDLGHDGDFKTEALLGQHQSGKQDLSDRIHFRNRQRPDLHRPVKEPRKNESADDHDIPRNDENHECNRQRAGDAE